MLVLHLNRSTFVLYSRISNPILDYSLVDNQLYLNDSDAVSNCHFIKVCAVVASQFKFELDTLFNVAVKV